MKTVCKFKLIILMLYVAGAHAEADDEGRDEYCNAVTQLVYTATKIEEQKAIDDLSGTISPKANRFLASQLLMQYRAVAAAASKTKDDTLCPGVTEAEDKLVAKYVKAMINKK